MQSRIFQFPTKKWVILWVMATPNTHAESQGIRLKIDNLFCLRNYYTADPMYVQLKLLLVVIINK